MSIIHWFIDQNLFPDGGYLGALHLISEFNFIADLTPVTRVKVSIVYPVPFVEFYPDDPAEVNTDKWLKVLGPHRFWDRGKVEKKYTKETQKFYELLDEVETAWADYRYLRKTAPKQKAKEFGRKNKAQINLSKYGRKVRQNIAKINDRIRLIELSRKKSPDQKQHFGTFSTISLSI